MAAAPEKTLEQILANPNVVFVIQRSKNKNVVVYEAKMDANGKLDPNEPVSVYWMDIDPEYVAANRKNGVMTDRSELGMVERSMAYGVSGTATGKENEYQLSLVALPSLDVKAVVVDGRPRCITTLNGKTAYLSSVYVVSHENWIGLPTVEYVDVTGEVVGTNEQVTQRIMP